MLEVGDILRCPACRTLLTVEGERLACRACGAFFRRLDGFWDLLPPQCGDLKLCERRHYTEKIDYYVDMHATWKDSPFYLHYHRSFLEDLGRLPAGSLVLELGAGLGTDGLELLRRGYRLVETDIAPGQLGEARRLHEGSGFGEACAHLLADAENLPFADGCFDAVLMVACLHHLPDPSRALREVVRVLKPGGTFVLGTEPNNWQHRTIFPVGKVLLRLAGRLLGREVSTANMVSEADKLTEGFSRKELDALFAQAGFGWWSLKPAGYLSAAVFFLCIELSPLLGRDLRLFPLERLLVPLDEALGRLPVVRRYPWHWNAVAARTPGKAPCGDMKR